ncbi:MAG: hypothetical protein WCJ37_05805 [Syntrophus sp. (in: bacteria)]
MKREDLIKATDKANNIFKSIMDNYSGLKGYLVFSSPHGQCELTSDPLQILIEFPTMISESEFKDKGIELLETFQKLEAELKNASKGNMKAEIEKNLKKTSNLLAPILEKIEVKEDTFIEVRFSRPILDLIFKMQKDPLVSQVHTPQTQASIRIVLGTLRELAQQSKILGDDKE